MKNLTYIPFKKNRYFYGKLLTADDFEQEQQYFDDKRRLVNRWVLGAGIVAGLEVIRVDDYSISVEMGLALDYTGREIVVDMPVIRKLSLIDGYAEATMAEGDESLYLCIEYAQTPIEPVHNITNRAVHTREEEDYNKFREGYRLYVTDEEPPRADEVMWQEEASGTDGLAGGGWRRAIYERAEQIHQQTYQRGIYLARVNLVKAGDFYMIDQVTPLAGGQYVCHLPLLLGMVRRLEARGKSLEDRLAGLTADGAARTEAKAPDERGQSDWQFQQGRVSIPVPAGSRAGQRFFSAEIAHGLGLGDVELVLHVIRGNFAYSGDGDIFSEEEKTAEAAARCSRDMGTFLIGIRLLEPMEEAGEVTVGWTAIRRRSRNEIRPEEARIYISPGIVNLKTRGEARLEAVCVNLDPGELVWKVETPGGGTIDEDGAYHAPNRPGVYEVSCRRQGQEQVRATVYIVVRE